MIQEDIALCVPETGPLRSYLEWASKTTDAEHQFHLGSILPVLANEVVSAGFTVGKMRKRPVIWSFIVGASGGGKTTAMRRASHHYRKYLATKGTPDDPYIFAEGSWPGIFEALAERFDPQIGMGCGIVTRDEAVKLLAMKDSIADSLCNVIDGEEVKRHLRSVRAENRNKPGSVKDTLQAPAFSGVLATTFAGIRDVTESHFVEGGLYSRFLWFVGGPLLPEPLFEPEMHDDVHRRVIEEWVDWGKWLLGMQALNDPEERVVHFEDDSKELLRATLHAELCERRQSEDRLNSLRRRGTTQAQLLAALYAVSDRRTLVTYEDMTRAINTVVLSTAGLSGLDEKFLPSANARDPITLADMAFQTIAAMTPGGCPRSHLYRVLKCPKHALESVVDTLIDEGSISTLPTPPGSKGRPMQAYVACRPRRYGDERARVNPGLRLIKTEEPPADVLDAPKAGE